MKRVTVLIILCTLLLTACGNEPNASTEATIVPIEPSTTQPTYGEPADDDYLYVGDTFIGQYTSENLPDEYRRKDFDGDGISNEDEIAHGTNMYNVDTDGDGLSDYDEIKTTKTDPLKWSSRDDDVSDSEYIIISQDFKPGYSATNVHGFKFYFSNPEDRLGIMSKVSTNAFDALETISEAFQVKDFAGKMAVDCSKYVDEVANSIAIYKEVNGVAVKIESAIENNRLVVFNVEKNDIIVLVYEPIQQ